MRWPAEQHRRAELQRLDRPRLLLLEDGASAPVADDELEDWIRVPASEDDLRARVPTANFFQPNGYWRNPIARRTGVVANLIAEIGSTMQREALSQGARDLAAAF